MKSVISWIISAVLTVGLVVGHIVTGHGAFLFVLGVFSLFLTTGLALFIALILLSNDVASAFEKSAKPLRSERFVYLLPSFFVLGYALYAESFVLASLYVLQLIATMILHWMIAEAVKSKTDEPV